MEKRQITKEELIARWQNAKQRKQEHIANLERELNKELAAKGLQRVTLEAW